MFRHAALLCVRRCSAREHRLQRRAVLPRLIPGVGLAYTAAARCARAVQKACTCACACSGDGATHLRAPYINP
eukprot:7438517-Alexandrium_andersonii.AAC.1